MRLLDLSGQRFGQLVAVRMLPERRNTFAAWVCRCDCGSETVVTSGQLRYGKTRSCGCLKGKGNIAHGMSSSREHNIWRKMKERCENPNCKSYGRYGGRGITVCERWQSFANFYADMGPSDGLTLERIDNNRGYEPGNCCWASNADQAANKRNTKRITFNGETLHLSEWARRIGVGHTTLVMRLNAYGWPIERALTTPGRSQ